MKSNLLRIVHTGKNRLGWDDETYRAALARETGKRSAKDCTEAELERMVRYLRAQGFVPVPVGRKGMLSKIEALLAEGGRPWSYLEGVVERMLGEKKPVEWLNDDQVRKLMQMLIVDAKRHGRG
ncbi:gp16 family protein [Serratia liquefaciens]|uniref:gp16 family protein n=1 Tax=Serratia liquefaciens TaxID=614 RepID=UPI003906CA05